MPASDFAYICSSENFFKRTMPVTGLVLMRVVPEMYRYICHVHDRKKKYICNRNWLYHILSRSAFLQASGACSEDNVSDFLVRRNRLKNCSARGRKAKKAATRTMMMETGAATTQKKLWVRFEVLMSLVFIPKVAWVSHNTWEGC